MISCRIWLTFLADHGSLFLLLPTLPMERDGASPTLAPETDITTSERRNESQSRSILQRLREGVRAKVLAAGLAIGGAAAASDQAEAAIMRPAEVLHTAEAGAATDDELGFEWEGGQLFVANAEDEHNRDIYWVGIRSMDDTQADASLPLPGFTPVPDRIIGPNAVPADGIASHDIILDGQLKVREGFLVAIGLEENGDTTLSLESFLQGSRIYVSYGPIHGDPTNIEEAISMTDGIVYEGQIPDHVDQKVSYFVRPAAVSIPEPSALALGGLAAGGLAAGAAFRRRRKTENDTRQ